MTPSVRVRVPAKVNLDLGVGPLRADGYHELSTVFHAVSLYDDVTVSAAPEWEVVVRGPEAHKVPVGSDNLARRAAELLADLSGTGSPVRIVIDKDIPVAGGMAGGSADAAATLVACSVLWDLEAERDLLDEAAAQLGSDINFALVGGTAMGSSRGELLAPVLGRGRYHWVLALADEGLSTPLVFAECDRLRRAEGLDPMTIPTPGPSSEMMSALRSGDAVALGRCLRNDLEVPAFHLRPELSDLLDAGLEYGALGGVVSGSGPTVAFLVDGAEGQLDLAVALTASRAADDVRRATGPVHGAHVVPDPAL